MDERLLNAKENTNKIASFLARTIKLF